MDCTAYSCQVMTPAKAAEAERTKLSRSTVVDGALALADAEGVEALTIRRLAQELGVTPMALYWHFRNKEELIAGLTDRIWGEIRSDVDEAAPWPLQLRSLLESLIDVLRAHESATSLMLDSEKFGASHWQVTEVTLDVLRRAGFDPLRAAEILVRIAKRNDIPYHLPLGVLAVENSIELDQRQLADDRKWRGVSRSADFSEPYPVEFPPDFD